MCGGVCLEPLRFASTRDVAICRTYAQDTTRWFVHRLHVTRVVFRMRDSGNLIRGDRGEEV